MTGTILLLVCGILFSLPLIVLLLLIPRIPVSPVGTIYLFSYVLFVLGMILAPWKSRYSSTLILLGITIAVMTLTIRMLFPPSGTRMHLITLPEDSGPRLLSRLLDEQDVVLFGAQVAPYLGAISPLERESLDAKFTQAFRDMKREGVTPLSPFLTTYLNQQSPANFDVVIAEPDSKTPLKSSIVFLHGFGGNFTLQCWLMAQAGNQINAMTVCPSTGPIGTWWDAQGQAILQETISYLQRRGVERLYLAGLSNGAIGASRLAAQYRQDIAGLILISGADPSATIIDLPVLLLHGKDDERIPVSVMEAYAAAAGAYTSYHLFEGDHFLLLKEANQVQQVMIDWLRRQELNSE